MSTLVKYIDQALMARVFYKFQDILGLTTLSSDTAITPKSVALRHVSEKRGKDEMEFINLFRVGTEFDWARQRSAVARNGFYTGSITNGACDVIKTVPAKLEYNVWFWSKDLDKINQVAERYIFWQHQDPNLDLLFNDTFPLELDLHFGEVVDESPIDQMYEKGLFFVIRVPITVDAWIFDSTFIKIIKKITLDCFDDSESEPVLLYENIIGGGLAIEEAIGTDTVTVVKS